MPPRNLDLWWPPDFKFCIFPCNSIAYYSYFVDCVKIKSYRAATGALKINEITYKPRSFVRIYTEGQYYLISGKKQNKNQNDILLELIPSHANALLAQIITALIWRPCNRIRFKAEKYMNNGFSHCKHVGYQYLILYYGL